MKKRIHQLTILLLVSFLSISFPSIIADPELHADIFGASMLTGLRRAGCIIYNSGTDQIQDISYTFAIKGAEDTTIDFIFIETIESIDQYESYTLSTNGINGYGKIIISITATSSNAGEISETRTGFQIGPYTLCQPYLSSWS